VSKEEQQLLAEVINSYEETFGKHHDNDDLPQEYGVVRGPAKVDVTEQYRGPSGRVYTAQIFVVMDQGSDTRNYQVTHKPDGQFEIKRV
jgi:hypothetical protein